MHAGVWALAWCAWKRRIHGKQGNKVACNIDIEDINFCLGTCNMGLWPCIQKWSPIKFSRYHLSDKILEQSLVFTKWDYSCMGQSQQVFCKKNASWCYVQCTGILLVHENNTWQNSTANEGFESVGRGCLDLARGSQNIGDPFVHRCLCHWWTRNGSGSHASSSTHVGDELAWVVFFCPTTPPEPPTDRPATRKLRHPTVAAHIMTSSQPTRQNSRKHGDISYKQRRKSYKIPDFHTNMTDFITFKWTMRC